MTLDLAAPAPPGHRGHGPGPVPGPVRGPARRLALGERRRLAQHDRDAARLAELHHLRALLDETVAVVGAGWVQDAWFRYRDDGGRLRTATGTTLLQVAGRPVTGACLVGAVVHAAGGPHTAGSQAVQRTLDLVWRTLHRADTEPGGWCPPPTVRAARVRDLARWNDDPARTARQVQDLLLAAGERARAEAQSLARAHGVPGAARAGTG